MRQRPFLKAVSALGWALVFVLKQERLKPYPETPGQRAGAPPPGSGRMGAKFASPRGARDLNLLRLSGRPVQVSPELQRKNGLSTRSGGAKEGKNGPTIRGCYGW